MKEIFFKLLEREAWGDMTAFRKECLNHHIIVVSDFYMCSKYPPRMLVHY